MYTMNKHDAMQSTGVGENGATWPILHQSPLFRAVISKFKAEHVHHLNKCGDHLIQSSTVSSRTYLHCSFLRD